METACAALLKNEFVALVGKLAADRGIAAFLVGGCIRDVLLGREFNDFDFVLSDKAELLPKIFADLVRGTFFWLDEQRLQSRVVTKDVDSHLTFDFSLQQDGSILSDLGRRDFSVNALALSLAGDRPQLIDPLQGMRDLRRGVIRACSATTFDDDPLRLLRAHRFAAVLGFAVATGTRRVIRAKAPLIRSVASERIRDELFIILETPHAAGASEKLFEAGLLAEIVPLGSFPDGNGEQPIAKRLHNLSRLENLHALSERRLPGVSAHLQGYLSTELESGVAIGSVAKLCLLLGEGEELTERASRAAERLKLGKRAGRLLAILAGAVAKMPVIPGKNPTERAFFRFFRDREPAGPAILLTGLARGLLSEKLCAAMFRYYFAEYASVREETLLSGKEIMAMLGTGPGKAVGEAMAHLKRAESLGLVNDKVEAAAYLKNLLTKDEAVI